MADMSVNGGVGGISGAQGLQASERLAEPAAEGFVERLDGHDVASPTERAEPAERAEASDAVIHDLVQRHEGIGGVRGLVEEILQKDIRLTSEQLLYVQAAVHEYSFKVESVSKAIEHGMNNLKTMQQTQI